MQRISQVGVLAAQFGATLSALADVAESEMQEVFRCHEQDDAELRKQCAAEIATAVSARDDMHQQVIRAGQQLSKAASEIAELKTQLAAGDPDERDVELLEQEARQLLVDINQRTAKAAHPDPLLTRMEQLIAKLVPADSAESDSESPKLAVVAEAVALRENQPATNVAS